MKRTVKFVLIIVGMLVIFNFSNQVKNDSDNLTTNLITKVVKATNKITHKNITNDQMKKFIKKVFVPVRKCAHFTVYFILALLIISFLKEFDYSLRKKILITLLICFTYACTDEFHQLFVPGRSAAIRDVFIDTLGAELGMFIYLLKNKIKK